MFPFFVFARLLCLLRLLKSDGVGDLTLSVPSIQHSFPGVVVHHGVVSALVCELYVGVPLFSSLGVVSKVDGSGPAAVVVDTVDHSTCDKSIAHRTHWLCVENIYVHLTSVVLSPTFCTLQL